MNNIKKNFFFIIIIIIKYLIKYEFRLVDYVVLCIVYMMEKQKLIYMENRLKNISVQYLWNLQKKLNVYGRPINTNALIYRIEICYYLENNIGFWKHKKVE